MAKAGHPIMLKLVEKIMKWLNDESRRQNVGISQLKLDFNGILSGTGPSAFTEAIMEDMSSRVGRKITWMDSFHNMAESKLIAGYLVLTVEAFAAGQGHSDSGNHFAISALVKHHYHASGWPTLHPRFSHPIYGEGESDFLCKAELTADSRAMQLGCCMRESLGREYREIRCASSGAEDH